MMNFYFELSLIDSFVLEKGGGLFERRAELCWKKVRGLKRLMNCPHFELLRRYCMHKFFIFKIG